MMKNQTKQRKTETKEREENVDEKSSSVLETLSLSFAMRHPHGGVRGQDLALRALSMRETLGM